VIRVGVVLAAGGQGLRMGAPVPKQFLEIDGLPVYRKALLPFLDSSEVGAIAIGMPAAYADKVKGDLAAAYPDRIASGRLDVFVGGARRQDTVDRGVRLLFDRFPELFGALVHDAARPFLAPEILAETIRALGEGKAVGVGVPVADTLWRTETGEGSHVQVAEIVPRERMVAAQTPQGGPRDLFLGALDQARLKEREFTDEASLFLGAGIPFHLVLGSGRNRKITRPEDLSL
jgi:2-C-methyl-D-erythritol 4-phosphate cytidylyltransferase/2-C-methyl-D-erythritol 2,4-cyclodiphosphate synthase